MDVALTALATIWIGVAASSLPHWTVDDAFIVLRYADNLVAHGDLAFNANAGDRVEGFTSPFAMIVAIVLRTVGADPIAGTKLLSLLAALACPTLVLRLARGLRAPTPAGGFAALLFALAPEHAVHARSGLETEIFVAATLAFLAAFVRVLRSPSAPLPTFSVLALVCALVRPEGIPIAAIAGACLLYVRRRDRKGRRALVRTFGAIVVAPLAGLTLFRLAYFHALLPNTFYAKRAVLNAAHAHDLLALSNRTLVDLAIAAAALFAIGRLVARPRRRLSPRRAIVLGVSALVLAVQLAGYARAEPVMDYGRRFAWHGAAFLVPFIVATAAYVVQNVRSFALVAIGVLVVADTGLRSRAVLDADRHRMVREAGSIATLQAPAVAWIEENTAAGAVIGVYPDAGFLPWITKRKTIDFGKLNDRVLARTESDSEVAEYFFARSPDAIVIARLSSGRLYDSGAQAIVGDPRFAGAYVLARVVPEASADRGDSYEIYRRRP